MFLSSLLIPLTLLVILTSAIPTETSTAMEDDMASPKPSVNTATDFDAATSSLSDSSTPTSTSTTTLTSTVLTTGSPETITKTLISATISGSALLSEPSEIWVPDTESSTSSCTDKDKDKTKPPHTHHTHIPSTLSTKTRPKSKHSPHPTSCTTPYHLPIATNNAHPFDIASNSYACSVPMPNKLLRRCDSIPTGPLPGPEPDPYPSHGLCIAPPMSMSTGYATATATSTSTSTEPEMKTMAETMTEYASIADGYTILPTVRASVISSVASSAQVPIQTFSAVPQEEVPGDDGEGQGGKEPACGKGMSAKACPPVDGNM